MKNQARPRRHTQSGSIFFWIFFMVFLFGALSIALTQGLRGGGATMNREQARIGASEIMAYGQSVRDGVKTLRINGIPLREISFEMVTAVLENGAPYVASNDNCSIDRCKVFKPAGGNIKEADFHDLAVTPGWWTPTWARTGTAEFELADVNGVGTSASDLVMKVVRIKPEICKAINKMSDLGEDIYDEDQTGNSPYIYAWDTDAALAANNTIQYGYDEPALARKMFFCTGDPLTPADGGDAIFVLHVR